MCVRAHTHTQCLARTSGVRRCLLNGPESTVPLAEAASLLFLGFWHVQVLGIWSPAPWVGVLAFLPAGGLSPAASLVSLRLCFLISAMVE